MEEPVSLNWFASAMGMSTSCLTHSLGRPHSGWTSLAKDGENRRKDQGTYRALHLDAQQQYDGHHRRHLDGLPSEKAHPSRFVCHSTGRQALAHSDLGARPAFHDAYKATYVSLKGNHQARANLYKSIARSLTLQKLARTSSGRTQVGRQCYVVIFRRLKNEVQKDRYGDF